MKSIRSFVVLSIIALSAGLALAQGGPGPGPQAGAGPASAPGMGPAMGRGPGGRWGSDVTPGWTMMTPEERTEHQNRMSAMKTYDECSAYLAQHRQTMATRAQQQGKPLPPMNRDACAGLKK